MNISRDAAKAGIAACWRVLGGAPDPLAANWAATPEAERAFWLAAAGVRVVGVAGREWAALPQDVKTRVRLVLRRAADRAALLLDGGDHEK